MKPSLVPNPTVALPPTAHYRVRPRDKRTFLTVLDAHDLFSVEDQRCSAVSVQRGADAGSIVIEVEHPFRQGLIRERLTCAQGATGLRATSLDRVVLDVEHVERRREHVDFSSRTIPLPEALYPEVMLPFVLRWFPFDGQLRSVYAWMNDRFVARVYHEQVGETTLDLPIGKRRAIEFMMYPDFGDWVPLGTVLTKLSKAFVPKYRMWFEPHPPYSVLRFEGPYGPPGSVEIVLELERLEG